MTEPSHESTSRERVRFLVVGSFHIPSRRLFVLVGDVVDGRVEPGMEFAVDLNPSLAASGRIETVEAIRGAYLGREYLGLVVAYDEPDELEFWDALNISDEEIALTPVAGAPTR